MCPPRCECRPTPWEGSSDARCCHWRRANPAMELHPVAALCVGDGGTGVDRAVPESDFWICAPGRIVLEPRRHVVARVLHAGVLVDDRGHNFHLYAEAYGERVARRAHRL